MPISIQYLLTKLIVMLLLMLRGLQTLLMVRVHGVSLEPCGVTYAILHVVSCTSRFAIIVLVEFEKSTHLSGTFCFWHCLQAREEEVQEWDHSIGSTMAPCPLLGLTDFRKEEFQTLPHLGDTFSNPIGPQGREQEDKKSQVGSKRQT